MTELIDLAKAARVKAMREAERREQAFIEACEQILDTGERMPLTELVRRARDIVEAGR